MRLSLRVRLRVRQVHKAYFTTTFSSGPVHGGHSVKKRTPVQKQQQTAIDICLGGPLYKHHARHGR